MDGWERALKRTERRLARVRRKKPEADRLAKLEAKADRLRGVVALPADQRPARPRLSVDLVARALDLAAVVLAATPAGPALAAVKVALASAKGLSRAVAAHDLDGALDEVRAAVRAELASRGIALDDGTLDALVDAVDDQLET